MAYPTHLEHFGKQIKTMREYRALTQSELAEQAGIRQATISDIEAGKTNFEINTLIKICSALNFIFDYSFTPSELPTHGRADGLGFGSPFFCITSKFVGPQIPLH